ncbi:MAG: ribosome hibernation-promoting factor, HPF/YfiA family [Bacteroidota bacterium]
MKTTFATRHFESKKDLKTYSLNEITKLEQFYDRIVACDVVLEPNEDHDNPCTAELRVKVPKKLLHASESGQTYEQAIHNVVDNLVRQIRKYKTQHVEQY